MSSPDLKAIRDRIAAQHPAGVHALARPALVSSFPCYIVQDPTRIEWHASYAGSWRLTIDVRVVVGRRGGRDATPKLDELITSLPAALEAITSGGLWDRLAVTSLDGGYLDFIQGAKVVGLAADLTLTLTS